jgi:hypothetical protein
MLSHEIKKSLSWRGCSTSAQERVSPLSSILITDRHAKTMIADNESSSYRTFLCLQRFATSQRSSATQEGYRSLPPSVAYPDDSLPGLQSEL